MTYNTVIFDVGFTLVTFEGFTLKKYFKTLNEGLNQMAQFLQEQNILSDIIKFKKKFKKFRNENFQNSLLHYKETPTENTLKQTLKSLNLPQLTSGLEQKAVLIYHSTEGAYWKVKPTAKPVLQKLRAQKFKLGVLSNAPYHQGITFILDTSGIAQYFDYIASSAQIGLCKPDPRTFEFVLKKLQSVPEETIMVGDDLKNDIYGAQQLGMKAIHIKKGFEIGSYENMDVKPDGSITDLREILPVIQEWNSSS